MAIAVNATISNPAIVRAGRHRLRRNGEPSAIWKSGRTIPVSMSLHAAYDAASVC